MFPTGAPGVGLLVLRISLVAVAILSGEAECMKPTFSDLLCIALAGQSLLLCLGFLTPFAAGAACLFELSSWLFGAHADARFMALASLNSVAIVLLGPGGYSLDARLHGRRVVVFEPGRKDE